VLNDPETWDSGTGSWTNTTGDATLSNPGGNLQISFDAQIGVPAAEWDTISSTSNSVTGNYQLIDDLQLRFQFTAADILPFSAAVYFHSTNSGTVWEYSFLSTVTVVGSPQWQTIPFAYSTAWNGYGGSVEFMADLAGVDWIGINIGRAMNIMQQDYHIDDWQYVVPEPGAVYVLLAAFLSLGLVFRLRVARRPV